ncbi:MAG: glycosyltransferase family 2 protein [Bacteroidetes bacterium]|nr:glycosyltransferase family 2 protein [Bacteroidota bacterium]
MNSAEKILSVVIVNYNTDLHLNKCLKSLSESGIKNISEIIAVDNNSTDRNIEKLNSEFPDVKLFLRDVNDGFAGGCNYGAERAEGKYLLFLNPDVQIKGRSPEILTSFLEKNKDTGIVSGVMYDDSENVQYFYNEFPSLSWEIDLLISGNVQNRIDRLNSIRQIKENKNFEADWFHGAFILISREDFIKAGKFNEEYFMYYEDVELCYKVKNILNKKIVCIPEFRYYHSTKSSLDIEASDDIYIFHLNRSKLIFLKNYGFLKRSMIYLTGLTNIVTRIIILPFWNKYKGKRAGKLNQLLKVLKLYLSSSYVRSSKYEFIRG